jgi:hypothetical protein
MAGNMRIDYPEAIPEGVMGSVTNARSDALGLPLIGEVPLSWDNVYVKGTRMTKALEDGIRWTNQKARLKSPLTFRQVQPMVDPGQWYQVVDPEELGFFVEVVGALRFVPWSHFEIETDPPTARIS